MENGIVETMALFRKKEVDN